MNTMPNNNLSFGIDIENKFDKERAILKFEGFCPCCGSGKTEYLRTRLKDDGYDHVIFQNKYRCKECGSEWHGNAYDQSYNFLTGV